LLLTDATHGSLSATRAVLGRFLDGLAGASSDAGGHFVTVMDAWLSERETFKDFDSGYYLIKYPSMRGGATGIYYGVDGKLGYSMCMLRTTRLNGNYRDQYSWRSGDPAKSVSESGTRGSPGIRRAPAGCDWRTAASACRA
jgi:hypothetical protein